MEHEYVTVGQLARMLGVKPRWVYGHISGIPHVRFGPKTIRFDLKSEHLQPRVHRPAVIQDEKPTLSIEKFWTLICELPTRRDKALVWTIALTGCREWKSLHGSE